MAARLGIGRWLLRIVLVVAAIAVVYVGVTFVQVWLVSGHDDRDAADVLVVLGAAQYDGEPSPVLQARLDHALELFEAGVADNVIVTGGKQDGDRFTEAFSSYDYLRSQGVPEDAIFLEVDGTNTYEQMSASRLIMDTEGFGSAVLVSDPYHSKRLLAIADEVGMDEVAVSPTGSRSSLVSLVRETVAVSLGRILGYRRLGNVT
jgi:uncharacterized SAM-binding protein YcdF (DUF218 family)